MDLFTPADLFIYGSTIITSFLGSFHCAGMCGPIVTVTAKNLWQNVLYQLGRLMGYMLLTVVAHFLGAGPIALIPQNFFLKLAPLLLGVTYILIALMMLSNQNFHLTLPKIISRPFEYFVNRSSFFVGFFSFTLPCGWLYAFVLGSLTLNSIPKSLILITCFWAGSLPLLNLAPVIANRIIYPLKRKNPNAIPLTILVLGLILSATSLVKLVNQENTEVKLAQEYRKLNNLCEPDSGTCTLKSVYFGELLIDINPKPVEMNKKMQITVKFKNTKLANTLVDLDITGLEMDMGYNRPSLQLSDHDDFHGDFILPVCSLSVMPWKLTLMIKNQLQTELVPFVIVTRQ